MWKGGKINPNARVGIRNKDSVSVQQCLFLFLCSILPVSVTPAVFTLCNRSSSVSNFVACFCFSAKREQNFFWCPRFTFLLENYFQENIGNWGISLSKGKVLIFYSLPTTIDTWLSFFKWKTRLLLNF